MMGFIHYGGGGGTTLNLLAATGEIALGVEEFMAPVMIEERPLAVAFIETSIEVDMANEMPLVGDALPDLYQGDTSDVVLLYPKHLVGSLLPDWTCSLKVLDANGGEVHSRPVDDVVSDQFRVYLTPDETAIMSPGQYTLIAELNNANTVPALRREVHLQLKIKPQAL